MANFCTFVLFSKYFRVAAKPFREELAIGATQNKEKMRYISLELSPHFLRIIRKRSWRPFDPGFGITIARQQKLAITNKNHARSQRNSLGIFAIQFVGKFDHEFVLFRGATWLSATTLEPTPLETYLHFDVRQGKSLEILKLPAQFANSSGRNRTQRLIVIRDDQILQCVWQNGK